MAHHFKLGKALMADALGSYPREAGSSPDAPTNFKITSRVRVWLKELRLERSASSMWLFAVGSNPTAATNFKNLNRVLNATVTSFGENAPLRFVTSNMPR